MAQDINRVTLIGRLTKDAELKTFDSGYGVLNFTVASNRSYKKNDQWVEEASFIDSKYFSKGASKLSEYMKKGVQIAIEGSLVQENWEKDGQKRSRLVIQAESVQLLSSKNGGSNSSSSYEGDAPDTSFPFG